MELFIPTVIRLPDTLHVKHVLELGVREQLRRLVRRLLPPPLPEVLQDVPHGRALQPAQWSELTQPQHKQINERSIDNK